MATIADLHTSISNLSDTELFTHIRQIRSLRREIPIKLPKSTKKKTNKKQMTIDEHLNKIGENKKKELLKKLLEIRGRKQNG